MTVIATLLAAAAVGWAASRLLSLPPITMMILSGLALQLLGLQPDAELTQSALMLGLTVLLFTMGAELNPQRAGAQAGVAVRVGIAQLLALGATGYFAALSLGLQPIGCGLIALATASSSNLVALPLLKRAGRTYEPASRVVMGVLLLQDVCVIFGLAALMRIDEGLPAVESAVLRTGILAASAWFTARYITPWLLLRLGLDEEQTLISTLAVLFAFVGAAWAFELPLVSGAFFAGYAVSSFPANGILRGQLGSLSDFFLAIFFTALGTTLAPLDPSHVVAAAGLIAGVLLITPVIVAVIGRRAGMRSRGAIEAGLLLAQASELSLVIGLLGLSTGHLDDTHMSLITLVVCVTTATTPVLGRTRVAIAIVHNMPRMRRARPCHDLRDHVVLLGCGLNTLPLVKAVLASGTDIVVIDDDPGALDNAEALGAYTVRADALAPQALPQANAAHARAVVSNLRSLDENRVILSHSGQTPVFVRVFEDEDIAPLTAAGARPVHFGKAGADAFLQWFDHRHRSETAGARA